MPRAKKEKVEPKNKRSKKQQEALAANRSQNPSELNKTYIRFLLIQKLVETPGQYVTVKELADFVNEEIYPPVDYQEVNRRLEALLLKKDKVSKKRKDKDYFSLRFDGEKTGANTKWKVLDEGYPFDYDRLRKMKGISLALFLSNKFLKKLLPPKIYTSISEVVKDADHALNYTDPNDQTDFSNLDKKVEVEQRAFSLGEAKISDPVMDNIYIAIRKNKAVTMIFDETVGENDINKYQGERLNIVGVIVKQPKIYVYVARDNEVGQKQLYKRFQANLIKEVRILRADNNIPNSFNLRKDFIDKGWGDILIDRQNHRDITIKILVKNSGNLIRDLGDFPLSKNQTITKIKDLEKKTNQVLADKYKEKYDIQDEDAFLIFKSKLTRQLIEYIVGRGKDFVVVEPDDVKDHVSTFLGTAADNYK